MAAKLADLDQEKPNIRQQMEGDCHIKQVGIGGGREEACVGQLVDCYAAASPATSRQVAKRVCRSW